jgi:hypothetical protein
MVGVNYQTIHHLITHPLNHLPQGEGEKVGFAIVRFSNRTPPSLLLIFDVFYVKVRRNGLGGYFENKAGRGRKDDPKQ